MKDFHSKVCQRLHRFGESIFITDTTIQIKTKEPKKLERAIKLINEELTKLREPYSPRLVFEYYESHTKKTSTYNIIMNPEDYYIEIMHHLPHILEDLIMKSYIQKINFKN